MELTLKQQAALECFRAGIDHAFRASEGCSRDLAIRIFAKEVENMGAFAWELAESFVQAEPKPEFNPEQKCAYCNSARWTHFKNEDTAMEECPDTLDGQARNTCFKPATLKPEKTA